MHKLIRTVLFASAVLFALCTSVRAQCTTVANTGCPGQLAPQCSGSAQIGQTLTIGCITGGRAQTQLMVVGGCPQTSVALNPPLTCVSSCVVGWDLGLPALAVDTGFNPLVIPIPNDPALIGGTLCFQCLESNGLCWTFSPAVSVTF